MSASEHTRSVRGYISFDDEESLLDLTLGNIVLCAHIEDYRGGIEYLRLGKPADQDTAQCLDTISIDIVLTSSGESPAVRKALADLLQQGADLLPEEDPSIAIIRQTIHDRAARLRGENCA